MNVISGLSNSLIVKRQTLLFYRLLYLILWTPQSKQLSNKWIQVDKPLEKGFQSLYLLLSNKQARLGCAQQMLALITIL